MKSRLSPTVLIFLMLPALAMIVAALMLLNSERGGNASLPPPAVTLEYTGYRAPEFTLTGINGETIRLVDLRGRVVFVNFWATDCEPCVREMPAFEAFMQEQPPDGAVVLAVNGGESAETVSAFLDELGVDNIPIALDTDLSVRGEYGVIGLPTTFILDAEGVVRSRKMGEITLDNLRTYVRELS